jgi:oligosaccharide repeat unit polymerase
VGVKNGFSLAVLREFLVTDDPLFGETLHQEMFNTIQGVTTCTQFGVAAVPLGVWLYFRGKRYVLWPMAGLFGLAMVRALMFSERLAVIELLVPAAIVTLRMQFLGHACTKIRSWFFKLAPLIGVVALLIFFGAFEYVRSWRYYRYEFESYPQFVAWRVAGYYTTAHNNSAMALETLPPYPVPFATVQSLWTLAGMANQSLQYQNVTGVNPDLRHQAMLEQFGTPELNNEGGLFQPALDYGLAGMLGFWGLAGFVSGRAYRGYLARNLTGILCYALIFVSILETPRFLYLSYTRSLPPVATLLLVSATAALSKKRLPQWVALPATA